MKSAYLHVTFRGGKPLAASYYLYRLGLEADGITIIQRHFVARQAS
jgi:hypothetical protein